MIDISVFYISPLFVKGVTMVYRTAPRSSSGARIDECLEKDVWYLRPRGSELEIGPRWLLPFKIGSTLGNSPGDFFPKKNHIANVICLLVNCWIYRIYHAWKYYGYIIYTLLYLDGFMPQKEKKAGGHHLEQPKNIKKNRGDKNPQDIFR